MKTIYWIDDQIGKMRNVIDGIFPKLWGITCDEENEREKEEQIKNYILIFGNGYQDPGSSELYTQKMEEEFKDSIEDFFEKICWRIEGPSEGNECFIANRFLIDDVAKIIFKKESSESELKLYEDIKKNWGNMEFNHEKNEESQKNIRELISIMGIPEKACVGIDLELLYDDIARVKENHIIISMELYNQLQERGCKCFLYSTDTVDEEFVESWKSTYVNNYQDVSKITIKVYNRASFFQKSEYEAVNDLKKLCSDIQL